MTELNGRKVRAYTVTEIRGRPFGASNRKKFHVRFLGRKASILADIHKSVHMYPLQACSPWAELVEVMRRHW
jgi:hypothetical protein